MGRAVADPKYDWMTFTTPQPKANDRSVLMSRGKGLGGSSLVCYIPEQLEQNQDTDASRADQLHVHDSA